MDPPKSQKNYSKYRSFAIKYYVHTIITSLINQMIMAFVSVSLDLVWCGCSLCECVFLFVAFDNVILSPAWHSACIFFLTEANCKHVH